MSGFGNPRADSPGISGRESDLLMEAEMVDRKRIGAGLGKRYDGELAILVCVNQKSFCSINTVLQLRVTLCDFTGIFRDV
jgi:hypothetical protein